jgi:hypothetical protein
MFQIVLFFGIPGYLTIASLKENKEANFFLEPHSSDSAGFLLEKPQVVVQFSL